MSTVAMERLVAEQHPQQARAAHTCRWRARARPDRGTSAGRRGGAGSETPPVAATAGTSADAGHVDHREGVEQHVVDRGTCGASVVATRRRASPCGSAARPWAPLGARRPAGFVTASLAVVGVRRHVRGDDLRAPRPSRDQGQHRTPIGTPAVSASGPYAITARTDSRPPGERRGSGGRAMRPVDRTRPAGVPSRRRRAHGGHLALASCTGIGDTTTPSRQAAPGRPRRARRSWQTWTPTTSPRPRPIDRQRAARAVDLVVEPRATSTSRRRPSSASRLAGSTTARACPAGGHPVGEDDASRVSSPHHAPWPGSRRPSRRVQSPCVRHGSALLRGFGVR